MDRLEGQILAKHNIRRGPVVGAPAAAEEVPAKAKADAKPEVAPDGKPVVRIGAAPPAKNGAAPEDSAKTARPAQKPAN